VANGIIDIHLHIASTGDSGKGGRISRRVRYSIKYAALLLKNRLWPWRINDLVLQQIISDAVANAKLVDYAVALALDAIYDKNGEICLPATLLYVPNELASDLARRHPKILFGASVHPNRPDALEALEMCKEMGAVLVKWLPSVQRIDPLCVDYRRFYRKLASLQLPLLSHAGVEHFLPSRASQSFNDPRRLEFPLSEGVTVIVAHAALSAMPWDHDYFPAFLKLLDQAEKSGWKLYADVSAFASPGRHRQVFRVRQRVSPQRLILGSDFPVPSFPVSMIYTEKPPQEPLAMNPLDRNVQLLRCMGFPDEVFTNGAKILSLPAGKTAAPPSESLPPATQS
jgi:predicted TIM-barrel fold metal-dependent hydrolase